MKADVQMDERDRKAEWRGLKRMECLIKAFSDGKITNAEVDTCKAKSHSTSLLNIKYPSIPKLAKCTLVTLYPTTGAYKRKEIAPLPTMAKGNEPSPCTGMVTISTTPAKGSPKGAKGERVALTGFYSAGGLVKITGGFDVSKSSQQNSCPAGTKLFAPASRADWKTFLESTKPLRAPNFIVDVTSPDHGCALCSGSSMNSANSGRKAWGTTDRAPWWLRSTSYVKPNGKYDANCYLDVHTPNSEDSITFSENRCNYHSKSYYCQPEKFDLQPKHGPTSCKCTKVDLTDSYSAGILVKCTECTTVYKSTQKNSCPKGMKIFSPASRADWKTFLSSAVPLRAPNWIIDVTRPQNGCGGCTRHSMKSTTAQQATWRTSDASPWWLRSTTYSEPNGDYRANCYLALWRNPKSADTIQFNDWNCNYKSRSYYCQPKKSSHLYGGHHRRRRAPPPPTPKPRPRPVPKPRKGSTLKSYGGWSFAKVPTSDTSDNGIIAACKAAGMKVPCAGTDSCSYTNKQHCVVTSEVGCGNPMITTARQSGCNIPSQCGNLLKNVYTYMGHKWVIKDGKRGGCGTDGRGWCTQGSPKKAGYAFCAKSTSGKKYSGSELGSHGGWTFYKVPTKDTSDQGILNTCKNAGLVNPCAGAPGCHYNNKGKECVQTSERGCGNPMSTTSKASCGNKWPRDCKKFDNTFTFMGKVWAGGNGCGTKGGSWCTVGKKTMAGFAFCAQQTR